MSVHGSPFRQATGRCALCRQETTIDELAAVAGLDACTKCRSGELDDAIRVHGFEEYLLVIDSKTTTSSSKDDGFVLELSIPRSLEVEAVLSAEWPINWFTKLFRTPDPEVGFEAFDRSVRIGVEPQQADALVLGLGRANHSSRRASVVQAFLCCSRASSEVSPIMKLVPQETCLSPTAKFVAKSHVFEP